MTTTTKELIEKYKKKIEDRIQTSGHHTYEEFIEDLKHLQELPQQEVEIKPFEGTTNHGNKYKSKRHQCICGDVCIGIGDKYCNQCGAKIKRID